MGVRRGVSPSGFKVSPGVMLDAAKVFDAKNAVNRARAEIIDALGQLDQLAPSETLHKLRLIATQIDDVREDLKGGE